MDITKDNFAASLERVRAAICRCSFLALDCEFSGLSTGGSTCQYESPEERYAHLRRTASGFLVIQFGLAAFTLEREHNRYSQETFNFYLFPRHRSQGAFLCQPSSLEFLLDHGFDFNRLVREGIPYLRPAEVEILREHLERQLEENEAASPSSAPGAAPGTAPSAAAGTASGTGTGTPVQPVPESQAEFVDRTISEIGKFLATSDEYLDFHHLSAYQRKLLYNHVPLRISTPLELETLRGSGDQRSLRVNRALTGPERRERAVRRLRERVQEAEGFAAVIRAISRAGKPVVGHNMLLDLLHIVEQFVCPLPETFSEFKAAVHCVFPTLVDTKVMGSTQPFRDLIPATNLAEMTTCLTTHPFTMPEIVPAEGSGGPEYSLADRKHHQAGYDAFLTAACFSAMVSHLGLLLRPPQPLLEPSAEIVRPFANKIFAMRMADLPYLNLTGEDLTPSRDHVFHLTFPAYWRTADIIQLFSPFSRVHVAWVDDSSAFVSLDRRDQTSQVLQNLKASGRFTLTTYSDWQARQRLSRGSKPNASVDSPAPQPRPSPAPSADGCFATPPSDGKARSTPHRTPPQSTVSDSGQGTQNSTGAESSTASGTANGRNRSAGKKRKRESSGSSENGGEDQKAAATKAGTELFTVPDW